MLYNVIRTQPRDIKMGKLNLKKGDQTVVHSGTKAECEKMAGILRHCHVAPAPKG